MCEEYQELISSYIDNELSKEEKENFEAHLSSCPSCEEELARTQKLLNDLRALPQLELPSGFHEVLMARIAKENTENKNMFKKLGGMNAIRRGRASFNFRPYANAAAAFVLTFILLSGVLSVLNNAIGSNAIGRTAQYGTESGTASSAATADGGSADAVTELNFAALEEAAADAASDEAANGDMSIAAAEAPNLPLVKEAAEQGDMGEIMFKRNMPDVNTAQAEAQIMGAELSDLLVREFYIEIEADDPTEAAEVIAAMQGVTLSQESRNRPDYVSSYISKRVSNADYESFIENLQNLGEIVNESETANKVNSYIGDLQISTNRKEEERERLLALMTQTNDITSLISIEERLDAIEGELDLFRTEQQNYAETTDSALIEIGIVQKSQARTHNYSLAQNIADTFTLSANMTIGFMEDALSFAAYAFLPAIILIAIVCCVIFFRKKRKGKR